MSQSESSASSAAGSRNSDLVRSEPEMAAPDYVEPVCGWRAWCVVITEEGVLLRSLVQETFWPRRRPLHARCLRTGSHDAPHGSCGCGIHATSEPGHALHVLEGHGYGRYARGQQRVASVLGRVFLWGEVVECESGWRAACAYPAHLFILNPASRLASVSVGALAAYGVPVEVVRARDRSETLAAVGDDTSKRPISESWPAPQF